MTIEEKMEHFKNISLENASNKSNDVLTAYKQSLDEQYAKHIETATIEAKSVEEARINNVKLEAKRALARSQSEIKRDITLKQNKMKSDIFSQVVDKLNDFKKTDEYKALLVKQIESVNNEFPDVDITFYIDSEDTNLLEYLKEITHSTIEISQTSFIGGTKAIIIEKNILVDNTFKSKLSEEQENFVISF